VGTAQGSLAFLAHGRDALAPQEFGGETSKLYIETKETFEEWKKTRVRGGKSKSDRIASARQLLAQKLAAAPDDDAKVVVSTVINKAYYEVFGDNLF